MEIEWMDGFEVHVSVAAGGVFISANREGLLSLARQLTVLAEETAVSFYLIRLLSSKKLSACSASMNRRM